MADSRGARSPDLLAFGERGIFRLVGAQQLALRQARPVQAEQLVVLAESAVDVFVRIDRSWLPDPGAVGNGQQNRPIVLQRDIDGAAVAGDRAMDAGWTRGG